MNEKERNVVNAVLIIFFALVNIVTVYLLALCSEDQGSAFGVRMEFSFEWPMIIMALLIDVILAVIFVIVNKKLKNR